MLTAIMFGALGGTVAALGYNWGKTRGQTAKHAREAGVAYKEVRDKYNLDDIDVKDIINRLYNYGEISESDYKSCLGIIGKVEKMDKNLLNGNNWDVILSGLGKWGVTAEDAAKLYNLLADKIPVLEYASYDLADKIYGAGTGAAVFGNLPELPGVPKPDYLDTDFENYQRPVDPVKWWTGQELADLHEIDYNPETYYNLIKQGTEANIKHGQYTSEQMNQASMQNDVRDKVDYLDAIRNAKSDAITSGATLGARAANELLANVEKVSNYAANQRTVADDRLSLMDELFRNDANARITANEYFTNKLAKPFSQDSETLYANDTARFGQDWLTNAELYSADQNLRGARAKANASMYANNIAANAYINSLRSGMQAQQDQYSWVFDNYLRANGFFDEGATATQRDAALKKSVHNMDAALQTTATGYGNVVDYYKNNK